jgi:hypothetical protein
VLAEQVRWIWHSIQPPKPPAMCSITLPLSVLLAQRILCSTPAWFNSGEREQINAAKG